MTARLALVVLVVATTCSCASQQQSRRADAIGNLVPTLHTIAPTHPTGGVNLPVNTTAPRRFEAKNVVIDEPTFHELHPLAWHREVTAYTADVLHRATAPLPAGPPVYTEVRFTTSFDHRDLQGGGQRVTVAIESALPDGRLVTSTPMSREIVDRAERWGEDALTYTGLALTGALLGLEVGILTGDTFATPEATWLFLGTAALALATTATAGVVALVGVNAAQERWSDLYLAALRAHAADVRRVIDGGVPALPVTPTSSPPSPSPP